jgi:hypothetical protein
MEKKPFLKHWSSLRASQKLIPKPVRYTHEGSTYAEDGVRITGSIATRGWETREKEKGKTTAFTAKARRTRRRTCE